MSEQVEQVSGENAVQEPKKSGKRRSPEEKFGRLKWNGVLLNRALDELQRLRKDVNSKLKAVDERLNRIEVMQSNILKGFRGAGLVKHTPPMLQGIACEDAVDVAILDAVFRAGSRGVLPLNVAKDTSLQQYNLKYYSVSRRIVRMNKKLFEKIGECLFEKRGLGWALTPFAFEVWGETEKEHTENTSSLESS